MSSSNDTLREIRRENDWAPDQPGELVGLLLREDGGQWVPATVFGAALGEATDVDRAGAVVRQEGLSSLADRWWVRVGAEPWRAAWLLEVKRDRVRLRYDDPMRLQTGHGEWLELDRAEVRRRPPRS
jgi:hypothetical protein